MLNTKNAYFYWVTREQSSFDWFRQIMSEIADSDIKVKYIYSFESLVGCLCLSLRLRLFIFFFQIKPIALAS